jgi:hypothetical protein
MSRTNATTPVADEPTEDTTKEGALRLTQFGQHHGGASVALMLCVMIKLFGYIGDILLSIWLSNQLNWSMETRYNAILLGVALTLVIEILVLFRFLRFWSAMLILLLMHLSLGFFVFCAYVLV